MNFRDQIKKLRRAAAALAVLAALEGSCLFALNAEPMEGGIGGEAFKYIVEVLSKHATGLTADEEARLAGFIIDESRRSGVDPFLVMALIETESTFYNYSRSYKGAVGLMQILPSTGKMLAAELESAWEGESTLFDPYENVRLGIRYYSRLNRRYGEDTMMTLAAYNAGPGNLLEEMRRSGRPPGVYAGKVMRNYAGLTKGFQERVGFN